MTRSRRFGVLAAVAVVSCGGEDAAGDGGDTAAGCTAELPDDTNVYSFDPPCDPDACEDGTTVHVVVVLEGEVAGCLPSAFIGCGDSEAERSRIDMTQTGSGAWEATLPILCPEAPAAPSAQSCTGSVSLLSNGKKSSHSRYPLDCFTPGA